MDYRDIGFDEFLNRIEDTAAPQSLDPQTFDNLTDQLSASKVQGGTMLSPDGRISLDLDQAILRISNGVQDLITLGVLPDASIGLLLKDNDGKILLQISGNKNLIQSSNQHMALDFNNETLTVTDDSNIPVVLLGKIS